MVVSDPIMDLARFFGKKTVIDLSGRILVHEMGNEPRPGLGWRGRDGGVEKRSRRNLER